jgi:DNA ligase-1
MEDQVSKYKIIFPLTYFYAKDSKGAIRCWGISGVIKNPDSSKEIGVIKFIFGTVGGQLQEEIEYVDEGLQSRNLKEQVLSRINSRIHNKKKSGYVDNMQDAENNKRVNLLGLERPMLAKKYKDVVSKIRWKEGAYIQPKLNGERCLIKKCGGEIIAYSRQGIEFTTLNHITNIIKKIPGDFTLDGELYVHGQKLQTINSWVKRKQPNTEKVQYHVYDIVMDVEYSNRISELNKIENIIGGIHSIFFVDPVIVFDEIDAMKMRDYYIEWGYEGAMIRGFELPYQDGKRSNSLLKMKKALDEEFLVVNISPSVHGWGILDCITKEGKKFSVSAPGSIEEKTEIYFNREKFIGRYCQVEFFEWTIEKKPFHPVALRFRDIGQE